MNSRHLRFIVGRHSCMPRRLDAIDVHYFYQLLKLQIKWFETVKKDILADIVVHIENSDLLYSKKIVMEYKTTSEFINHLIDEYGLKINNIFINGEYAEEPYVDLDDVRFMELE